MSPAELRRRATQKRADAAEMEVDSGRLRVQAAALRGLLDPLVGMSRQVWVGPAAQEFESQVRRYGGIVDTQAARLEDIAGELARRAIAARHSAAGLDAQAAAAEAAAAAGAAPSPVLYPSNA